MLCSPSPPATARSIALLMLLAGLADFGMAQTGGWLLADQEACIMQCMQTGVNCSSGCGIPNVCPAGWKGQIARRCYQIVYPTNPGYTQSEARAKCQNSSADLVSVHNATENSFLYGLIVNTPNPDGMNHNFWLGIQLARNSAGAVTGASWTDGTALDYGDPVTGHGNAPWAIGEPVNAGNCVRMMGYGPYKGKWYDANCNQSTTLVPTSGYFCKGCPDGWSAFQGHCYKAFVNSTRQGVYVQFERICSMFNSTIVSIHSQAENDFVLGLAQAADNTTGAIMIGLQLTRDGWGTITGSRWPDGTPVDFGWNMAGGVYPWADTGTGYPNQPDNRPSPGDCTLMWTMVKEPGRWDDITCTMSPMSGTVCKF